MVWLFSEAQFHLSIVMAFHFICLFSQLHGIGPNEQVWKFKRRNVIITMLKSLGRILWLNCCVGCAHLKSRRQQSGEGKQEMLFMPLCKASPRVPDPQCFVARRVKKGKLNLRCADTEPFRFAVDHPHLGAHHHVALQLCWLLWVFCRIVPAVFLGSLVVAVPC